MPVAGPVAVHDNIRWLTDEATSSLVMKLFELLLLVVLNHVVRITSVQNVLVSDIMSLFKAIQRNLLYPYMIFIIIIAQFRYKPLLLTCVSWVF